MLFRSDSLLFRLARMTLVLQKMPNDQGAVCIPDRGGITFLKKASLQTGDVSAVAFLNEMNQLHCHDRMK